MDTSGSMETPFLETLMVFVNLVSLVSGLY